MESNEAKVQNARELVKQLIAKGKRKGCLGYDEVADTVQGLELDAEQMEAIFDRLTEAGIKLQGDRPDEAEEPGEPDADVEALEVAEPPPVDEVEPDDDAAADE